MKSKYESPKEGETGSTCPHCKGRGITYIKSKRAIAGKKPGSMTYLMDSIPCICKKNEMVERKYAYLTRSLIPEVSAEEAEGVVKKLKPLTSNIIFQGGSFKFFHVVKAVLVHHAFSAQLIFELLKGIEVVSRFYVEQLDESGRKFEDLIYNRDLVVLIFNSRVDNKALKPVIQELIEGRMLRAKPTWIWTRGQIEDTEEYSSDLSPFLKKFRKVNCGTADVMERDAHDEAEKLRNLGGF